VSKCACPNAWAGNKVHESLIDGAQSLPQTPLSSVLTDDTHAGNHHTSQYHQLKPKKKTHCSEKKCGENSFFLLLLLILLKTMLMFLINK
jgi:hypothetical protein